jgi:hypothetical protein
MTHKAVPLVNATIVKVQHVKISAPARPVVRVILSNLERNRANLIALQREVNETPSDNLIDFHNGILTRFFEADAGCLPARKPIEG